MTFYLFLADRHGNVSGARWAIMGIAVKVGQSVSTLSIILPQHLTDIRVIRFPDWAT